MEKEFHCDVCNKKYKTEQTLKTHKNKFHKDIVIAENDVKIAERENSIQLEITEDDDDDDDDDESSCYSSCYESADEDGKWTCCFCKKRFERKDFKNYHEIVCLTHIKEIRFHKPTSISILDMLRITDKDFP
jgi:hypothetical protein